MYPGLKRLVEWDGAPSSDFPNGRDPATRFMCPGCDTHISWLVENTDGRLPIEHRDRDRCPYTNEHQAMHRYYEVVHAPRGSRLRFIGYRFNVDFNPRWLADWSDELVGWVGELDRLDWPHHAEVHTQERQITMPIECFELAGGASLGPIGGPREHSYSRSYWAKNGLWQLEMMLRETAQIRARHGASFPDALRVARVELERFLVEDHEHQAEYLARGTRGTPNK